MNKKSLKDWVKSWSIEDIVSRTVTEGMMFQSDLIKTEELEEHKKVVIKELNDRINQTAEDAVMGFHNWLENQEWNIITKRDVEIYLSQLKKGEDE